MGSHHAVQVGLELVYSGLVSYSQSSVLASPLLALQVCPKPDSIHPEEHEAFSQGSRQGDIPE